ncbi:hypothetical protein HCU40_11030 [Pseudanabaena biceps]|nr:hypothetical protein [Pseudanabaena biceps]
MGIKGVKIVGQAQLPPQKPANSGLVKTLGRVGAGLAIALTATSLGAFWYGRYFLNEQLSPLLQVELGKALKRPLQLGKVERVGWASVRFGSSVIPPTAQESNFLAVEAIEVKVDLWNYIISRQLTLDAVAEQPQIFLKQDATGVIQLPKLTPPDPKQKTGFIDLRTVLFQDTQLTIQTIGKGELVSLNKVQIDSKWSITDPQNQRLEMNGKGSVVLPNLAAIATPPNPEQLKKAINLASSSQDGSQGNVSFVVDWDLTKGQGKIDFQTQDLQIAAIQGFAISLPVEVQQGKLNSQSTVAIIAGQSTPEVLITAQISGGALKVPQLVKPITEVAGQFSFNGKEAIFKEFSGEYGLSKTTFEGTYDQQKGFNLNFASSILDIAKSLANLEIKLPIAIAGQMKLAAKLKGTLEKPTLSLDISTPKTVSFDRVVVDRLLAKIELQDVKTLQIKQVEVASAIANFTGSGQIRLPKKDRPAEVVFNSNLVGVVEDIAKLYDTKLPIAVGQISSSLQITGELANPQILAQIDAPNAKFPTKGEVLLANGLATIRNTRVKFPIGEVGLAGTYNVVSGAWKSQLNSSGIPLSAFLFNQKGIIEGLVNLRSDRGGFAISDITGDANLRLPQGLTEVPDAIAANLTWDGKNLRVPSLLVGNYLTANGLIDLAFANDNNNQLPTGIAGINLDLISRNVNVNRLASLSTFIPSQASGIFNFRGNLSGAIDRLKIAGDLQVDDVDLASFGSSLAKQGIVAPSRGSLNFDGSVNGDLASPRLAGNLRVASLKVNQVELDNLTFNGAVNGIGSVLQATGDLLLAGLRVDKLAFDPRLEGKLSFNGNQGLSVDLRGNKRDRLTANLDAAFRPVNFNVNLGESTAIGKRLENDPNRLQVAINNLPLALVASLSGQNDVSGKLSSKLLVNFGNNPTAIGEVSIERPRFGRILADQAIAQLSYSNGIFDIKDGRLSIRQGESNNEYKFRLTYNPKIEDQITGAVEIKQGRMQDLFATLQWVNLIDVTQGLTFSKSRAVELQPLEAIKLLGEPLYKQLQYLTQIELRQEQQEIADSTSNYNLPPLTDFRGDVQGTVNFALNQNRGIRLGFDLTGKNFAYGKFAVDDIQVAGRFGNGVFAISNANFQSGQSYGKISKARLRIIPTSNPLFRFREQSGEIELKDFPIESLRPLPFFSAIPFDLTGKVNGNLSISGTNLLDLKVAGKLSLTDGSVNRQAIDFIGVKFAYDKLNINFDATMNVQDKESVVASGNLGLFGFFDVKLDVKDEGIKFINIFNQPVSWLDGKGDINLRASGTLRNPKVEGKMLVDKASVRIAGLPGNFTDVQGEIDFNNDRLVSKITSNFSEGQLTLNGVLPISNVDLLKVDTPEYQQALAVNADKLKLNIRDISSDNFNTRVIVRGSLLDPILTGEVVLNDGRFVIGNDADPNNNVASSNNVANFGFDRLAVKLRNMQVTRFPLFNFLGEGDLVFNGSFQRPEPEGKINISRGQFNAISTRFRLDRSYENFVEFRPNQGLNPVLNVRVSGAVAEITRVPINSNRPNDLFSPNEVPVSNLGAQRTLRVQATVTGNALAPDIRLSSSPPRSQAEIVALIGGGVLQQQSGSDPASALASFAGGTILNFLQDAIGDALNLAEFNLSPVTTGTEGSRTGTLGLSAEAAIDVSNSFSVALQRIINDSTQPTNFSVRYRVDPNILLRGNYSSNGGTGISIEYENRF